MAHRTKHPHTAPAEGGLGGMTALLSSCAAGAGGGLLSALILCLGGALICSLSSDPHGLILPLSLAALYLSALLGGGIALRRHKSAPLLCGALCGAMMLLTLLLLSLFFDEKTEGSLSPALSLLLRALIPFFSILGARMAVKRRVGTGRKRRKR